MRQTVNGAAGEEDRAGVFERYSEFYDLLYSDKDYIGEVEYVCTLLHEFGVDSGSILEFGSGTGVHGQLLAGKGFHVYGIEQSHEMVKIATSRGKPTGPGSFECTVGDLGTTRLNRQFDCVLSLFHVISYQTTDQSIEAAFANALLHLKPGGVFVFDVWHAAAVLSQQPSVRVKRAENDQVRLTRIAEPTLLTEENCVRVDYTLFAEERGTAGIAVCRESHLMRYFSCPELRSISARHGFELAHSEEWVTRRPPSASTWGVCYVLRKLPE